jgi:hypothetical protein
MDAGVCASEKKKKKGKKWREEGEREISHIPHWHCPTT